MRSMAADIRELWVYSIHTTLYDQDAVFLAQKMWKPVSSSCLWFSQSVWPLDCRWELDDRLKVTTGSWQKSFQKLEVN